VAKPEQAMPGSTVEPAVSAMRRVALAAILVLAALVYLRCLNDGFVYDDNILIVGNHYLGQWSFLWKSLFRDEYWFQDPLRLPQSPRYRPLLLIWFALQYHLFGLNPVGWHATMIAVHLIAVWLVFRVAERLTGELRAALLAALLFALMPIHAQAVAWATGFGLVLTGAFQLGAFDSFTRRAAAPRRSWIVSLALYAGALLSHGESAVAFFGLVALYGFLFEARGPTSREVSRMAALAPRIRHGLVCASPFMAEMLIYLLVRKLILGNQAMGARNIDAVQFAATGPRVMASYLELLAMPWLATPGHGVLVVSSLRAPAFWLPAIILASLAAALFMLPIERRRRELYVFCAGWIVMSLAPVMYLPALRPDQMVADNYLYTASAGSSVLVADWIVRFSRRGAWSARLARSATAAMMLVCTVSLWRAQGAWHDDLSLFSRCVQDSPEAQICHSQLGTVMRRLGDLSGAARELSIARDLDPGDGRTLYELGQADAQLGRLDQGTKEVARGLSMTPDPPAYAYMVLAQLYYLNGEQARSEATLKYLETLFDGAHAAGLARARIEVYRGDAAGAETLLRGLTARYPDDERLWAMLGQARAERGRIGEALSAYGEAAKLAPGDPAPWLAAAQLLHASNRDREALEQCRRALAAGPDNPDALALMNQIERGITKR